MEKKVYYKNEYEGGSLNGACRFYPSLAKAVRYARCYVTRMSRNLCIGDHVAVRVCRMEDYREVEHYYIGV